MKNKFTDIGIFYLELDPNTYITPRSKHSRQIGLNQVVQIKNEIIYYVGLNV